MHSRTPPLSLMLTEPARAAVDYLRMRLMRRDVLPRGDDHPVVIFPGLGTDAHFTAPLARHCEELGYTTYDWGRGFNTGPQGDVRTWLMGLARDVGHLLEDHREKATLIGWSLGGVYAREVAKPLRRRARQVISIGAPFAGSPENTNAAWLYKLLNGKNPEVDNDLYAQLRTPPPVPVTSIYSRSDGIVAWQACREKTTAGEMENIEVESSHLGLPWNPEVLTVVADRLAQKHDAWSPWNSLS